MKSIKSSTKDGVSLSTIITPRTNNFIGTNSIQQENNHSENRSSSPSVQSFENHEISMIVENNDDINHNDDIYENYENNHPPLINISENSFVSLNRNSNIEQQTNVSEEIRLFDDQNNSISSDECYNCRCIFDRITTNLNYSKSYFGTDIERLTLC